MFASPNGWEPLQALAMPASGKLPGGIRLMSPGMFVRIRLPIGLPHKALLVIDRAIHSDQGLKYVYVLDADNKAEYRRVTTGSLQDDGLREIRDGLKADDWVAVGALATSPAAHGGSAGTDNDAVAGQSAARSP